jgi:hypothetical protein
LLLLVLGGGSGTIHSATKVLRSRQPMVLLVDTGYAPAIIDEALKLPAGQQLTDEALWKHLQTERTTTERLALFRTQIDAVKANVRDFCEEYHAHADVCAKLVVRWSSASGVPLEVAMRNSVVMYDMRNRYRRLISAVEWNQPTEVAAVISEVAKAALETALTCARQLGARERVEVIKLLTQELYHGFSAGGDLHGLRLVGSDLRGAVLNECDLRRTDLAEACLDDAQLVLSKLCRADLRGTSFRKALMQQADLRQCKMRGSNFEGANIFRVRFSTYKEPPRRTAAAKTGAWRLKAVAKGVLSSLLSQSEGEKGDGDDESDDDNGGESESDDEEGGEEEEEEDPMERSASEALSETLRSLALAASLLVPAVESMRAQLRVLLREHVEQAKSELVTRLDATFRKALASSLRPAEREVAIEAAIKPLVADLMAALVHGAFAKLLPKVLR